MNDGICVGVDGSGAALRLGEYDGEDVSPEAWAKVQVVGRLGRYQLKQ